MHCRERQFESSVTRP
nr:unnamed protein product [Callosobruchus chinensis]